MSETEKRDEELPWRAALGPLGTPRRFGPLLVLILITAGFQVAAPDTQAVRFVAIVLLAATLVATVWAAGTRRSLRIGLSVFAGVIVLLAGLDLFGPSEIEATDVGIGQLLLVAVVPTTIAIAVLRDLRDAGRVTLRAVFGVLCIYVVLGMAFAYIAEVIGWISGESFFNEVSIATISDHVFFSYATLTTVGYGDLTVANQAGRTLAMIEALLGQIYVVTVVAIIVGNLGSGRGRSESTVEAGA
ncbi:MAG: potassium channel family protein [Solirubrobacterales bacterium]